MTKVRINDLARELEVKSKPILDALEAIGVTGKTHSSSIDADQAERVRDYFKTGSRSGGSRSAAEAKPKFDLSHVSKPGDALRAILERKSAEAAAKAAPQPQRPAVAVAAPRTAPALLHPTAQVVQTRRQLLWCGRLERRPCGAGDRVDCSATGCGLGQCAG